MVYHFFSMTKLVIKSSFPCLVISFFLISTSNISYAQLEDHENLRLSDEVIKIFAQFNDCLAIEDFACAQDYLDIVCNTSQANNCEQCSINF
jgi:hypothetical protein